MDSVAQIGITENLRVFVEFCLWPQADQQYQKNIKDIDRLKSVQRSTTP